MIRGPFVLRKINAAQSAPVQVQPAQPVQPAANERVEGNVGPQGAASILKPMFVGLAIGCWMSGIRECFSGLVFQFFDITMLGLFNLLLALFFGHLSMAVD